MPDRPPRRPGLAALLSLLIPGAGQLYNRDWSRAAFWLVVTPPIWYFSQGLLGWLCHVFAALTAFTRAERRNTRRRYRSGHYGNPDLDVK